jgi:hypothetical protein
LAKAVFGEVPGFDIPEVFIRAGGKLEFEGEAEKAIDGCKEIKEAFDFLGDLTLD